MTGRYTWHRFMLRRNLHKNKNLQAAWTKYGEHAFVFEVLEHCHKSALQSRETHWIRTTNTIYNILPSANGAGMKHPPEVCERFSAAALRRWERPAYRAKREAWLAVRQQGRFVSRQDQARMPVEARREF
jgi:group I intron endonuclease